MPRPQDADTLLGLARAVLDLAEGMGGDEQEQHRAWQIHEALRGLAQGEPVPPLPPHNDARDAWFAARGNEA
jgi:hypothetical protein